MIESEKYKNHTIELHEDEDPINPRLEWDNVTEMVCFHRRYQLGDKDHGFRKEDYPQDSSFWDALREDMEKDAAVILPVYLYDHSGLTVNTTGFSCGWDSGQIGFIRITKEAAKANWPEYDERRLMEILVCDVKTYDTYLRKDLVGFRVFDGDGEEIESCWGYFDHNDAMAEARAIVDICWAEKHALFTQAGVEVPA